MKISIPEPCSEDWSKMTPTEQGAFCQKCALEVTDFTDKSALEIKSILSQKIEFKQRVCGHIENRQLVEFNHEFIPWNSDRESFRAIWVFSLIAVFGMTLFSCQSTFSKEVVEKMKTSSELLMEEGKDTLDLAKLNDSIQLINLRDSLGSTIWKPYGSDVITTGGPFVTITNGGMGMELPLIDWEVITCEPLFLGSIAMDGFILIDPAPAEEEEKSFDRVAYMINPMESVAPTPPAQTPRVNERNQTNSQRIDAKLEKGGPEFTAYISPIPVDATSKLYVTIPEEGVLKLSIWELNAMSKLHSENFDLVFGNHSIDINFMDFPNAKYATQLIWEDEKIVVPFEVAGTTKA